jgi:hypothetical protein
MVALVFVFVFVFSKYFDYFIYIYIGVVGAHLDGEEDVTVHWGVEAMNACVSSSHLSLTLVVSSSLLSA